jgi:geranylgeranyl diphosphate synthase type II
MSTAETFEPFLSQSRRWIDEELLIWQNEQEWSSDFSEALRHVLMGAGKAFRPALCFWMAKQASKEPLDLRPSRALLRLGLSLELMHTYSLIHDDLPAMDNDDFRRGRPTLHKMKNEAFAILAGDALLTASFEVLGEAFTEDFEKLPLALQILARASGASGMIEGQWRDICATKQDLKDTQLSTLESIHDLKTGALLGASVCLGALKSSSLSDFKRHQSRFWAWGLKLGRLFQMVDDYLDVTSSSEVLGKTAGKDQEQGKLTYPALLGLEECRVRIDSLRLELKILGDWAHPSDLDDLLNFVAHRKS